jgi:5'-nucleotidase
MIMILKNNKIFTLLVLLAFTATGLNAQDLVILHTNDTHSQILPETTGYGKGLGGYERREKYINSVRASHKNVLLLDAGDFSQGTPFFNIYKGDLEISLMNTLKYDVACIGNHEFDNGQDELARRINNASFKVVCANYNFSGTPLNNIIKPYTIVNKAGKKIGIIGLITNLKRLVSPKSLINMNYSNPIHVADSIGKKLVEEERCDLVIALTHLGYSSDTTLAKTSKYIDIIIGGHSHTNLTEKESFKNLDGKEVIVLQDGEKGEHVGRLDLWF